LLDSVYFVTWEVLFLFKGMAIIWIIRPLSNIRLNLEKCLKTSS
jgi:hypothetical protein